MHLRILCDILFTQESFQPGASRKLILGGIIMNMLKKAGAFFMAAVISAGMLSGCSGNNLPKIEISSLADIASLKIGVQSGTTGEGIAKENSSDPDNNVKGYRSGMDAALALKAGNIDCIIIDELPAESIPLPYSIPVWKLRNTLLQYAKKILLYWNKSTHPLKKSNREIPIIPCLIPLLPANGKN